MVSQDVKSHTWKAARGMLGPSAAKGVRATAAHARRCKEGYRLDRLIANYESRTGRKFDADYRLWHGIEATWDRGDGIDRDGWIRPGADRTLLAPSEQSLWISERLADLDMGIDVIADVIRDFSQRTVTP